MLFAFLVHGNSLTVFSGQRDYGRNRISNYNVNMVPLHMWVVTDVQLNYHLPPVLGIYLENQKTEWKLWGPRQISAEMRTYLKKQQTLFLDAKECFAYFGTHRRIHYLCWANTGYVFRHFDVSSYALKSVLMLTRERWYLKAFPWKAKCREMLIKALQ